MTSDPDGPFAPRVAGAGALPALLAIDPLACTDAARRDEIVLALAQRRCIAALRGDVCDGFVVFHDHFFGHRLVALVVVAPAARRRGLARALLAAAAHGAPSTKLFASTNLSNTAARRLFVRAGFVPGGRIDHLDPGDPELLFFKPLDPMARNVEIKARVARIAELEPIVAALADEGPLPIAQDDTFFRCAAGRLKLRVFAAGDGELIFYRRADSAGPKTSFHLRSPVLDPASMREALTQAHGQAGRVRKMRTLYLAGRTRIHLDRVDGLGEFVELEVVLREGEDERQGVDEAHALIARLGIAPDALIEGAYVDLPAASG